MPSKKIIAGPPGKIGFASGRLPDTVPSPNPAIPVTTPEERPKKPLWVWRWPNMGAMSSYKVRVSEDAESQIRQIANKNNLTPEQVVVKGVATLLYLDDETTAGHKVRIVDGEGNTIESDLVRDVILSKGDKQVAGPIEYSSPPVSPIASKSD